MRLGASIWGFYRETDSKEWPSPAEAVHKILSIGEPLGVEVWGALAMDRPQVSGQELLDLASACREAAFVTLHIQGRHWSWSPRNLRSEIDLAHQLGAETLVLHPVCLGLVEEEDRPDWPEIARIAEYSAKFGVRLAVENMRDSIWMLDRVLDEVGDDPEDTNLGVCIDIGHAHISRDAGREPITDYLQRYARQLVHLHLHDNHGESDEHLSLGDGTVDWETVTETLKQSGFSGTAVLEIHSSSGISLMEAIEKGLMALGFPP